MGINHHFPSHRLDHLPLSGRGFQRPRHILAELAAAARARRRRINHHALAGRWSGKVLRSGRLRVKPATVVVSRPPFRPLIRAFRLCAEALAVGSNDNASAIGARLRRTAGRRLVAENRLRNHALGMGAKIFARRCVMYARRAIWICRTGRSRLTSTVAFGPTLLLMLNLTAGNYLVLMVGVAGFEPTTPCPPDNTRTPRGPATARH